MNTQESIIIENKELRYRLALAEKWMQREIQGSLFSIQKKHTKQSIRKHFSHALEADGIEIFHKRIKDIFGLTLKNSPKYTLDRLIDAEIQWEMLQKYPHMDTFPLIGIYQKILDAWVESIITPWRSNNQKYGVASECHGIEYDLCRVLQKGHTLSLGRLYQALQIFRTEDTLSGVLLKFKIHLEQLGILEFLTSDIFFFPFEKLIHMQIFSEKRHVGKMSYMDAKNAREILLGPQSLLLLIFSLQS